MTLAGKLIGQGRDLDEVVELVRSWNTEISRHFDDDKIVGTCESVMMVDVVVNYLAANPAERHMQGDILVMIALTQAWPCPKKPATPAPTPEKPGTGRQGS